jgi:hypothetical protein
MGEKENAYRIFVGKSEGKRPFGRSRRRWKDTIKIQLREMWCQTGLMWLRIEASGGLL